MNNITLDTTEKEQLQKLQEWSDLILHHTDSFDKALKEVGMKTESDIAKLSDTMLDFVSHQIEQKILEAQ
jgi:hypothetical protein